MLRSVRRSTKPVALDLYAVFCAVLHLLRTGCQWRFLPPEFPKWQNVYAYWRKWSEPDQHGTSVLEQALKNQVGAAREKQGRSASSAILIVDVQSGKNTDTVTLKDYDVGKKISGTKRHIAVDTQGLPHANAVLLGTAGDITATLVNEFKKVSPCTPLVATSVALSGDNLRQLGGKASGIALSMVLPDAARTSVAVVRDYQKAMRALGYQEFSARSFEGYVNARVLTEGLERAGRDLTRAKLRNALASIRSSDLGGLSIDYASGAPYVGSRFLDLGVMGANGKFVG